MNHRPDCHVTPDVKPVDERALRGARSAWLAIAGIGCEHCATRVGNALLALDAVLRADVDADAGEAVVVFDPRRADLPELLAAVADAGNDGRHHYRARVLVVDGAGRRLSGAMLEPARHEPSRGGTVSPFGPGSTSRPRRYGLT